MNNTPASEPALPAYISIDWDAGLWMVRCRSDETCARHGVFCHTRDAATSAAIQHIARRHPEEAMLAEIQARATELASLPGEDDVPGHIYLSTGCLHGRHDYCQAMSGNAGLKRPATCKFCNARCICHCHTTEDSR